MIEMEETIDIWWEKANLATMMFFALTLIPINIARRVYGEPPNLIVLAVDLLHILFGFFIITSFWFKTVNLFESHPRLKIIFNRTLNILPWTFLSFSLIHQFIRLYYHILPNIGVTRTVLLLEGSYVLGVFLFGLAFYRIDLFAKINLVRMLSKRREDR